MDTKLAKKLNVNTTTIGEITDLRTPLLNAGNTSTVYIDGYMINSEDDVNGCLLAPMLDSNGIIINRLMVRKKINGVNIYRELALGIKADGSLYTNLARGQDDNSILTTVSHGTGYVRFGNGLQICWGSVIVGDGAKVNQNLPQAFKDNNYIVTFGHQNFTDSTTDFYHPQLIHGTKNTTKFTVYCRNAGSYHHAAVTWIAIGYWY